MNKNTLIFGIDVSKDVFDVYNEALGHKRYSNDDRGICCSKFFNLLSLD